MLYILFGVFLVIAVFSVKAGLLDPYSGSGDPESSGYQVSSGTSLTSALWNGLVNRIQDLTDRIIALEGNAPEAWIGSRYGNDGEQISCNHPFVSYYCEARVVGNTVEIRAYSNFAGGCDSGWVATGRISCSGSGTHTVQTTLLAGGIDCVYLELNPMSMENEEKPICKAFW